MVGVDLESRDELETLLRAFYIRVFTDDLLGHIFLEVARMDLDAHLPALGDFWQKVLFNTGEYHGDMMRVHQRVHAREPFTNAHFTRWLTLWEHAIDERYVGPIADLAKAHATRIARAMQRNLDRDARPKALPHSPSTLSRRTEGDESRP
jgi:hemoglobin